MQACSLYFTCPPTRQMPYPVKAYHKIRDEIAFGRHVEEIHFNPVKHGLVKARKDRPHSSFSRFVENGLYDRPRRAEEEMQFASDVGAE